MSQLQGNFRVFFRFITIQVDMMVDLMVRNIGRLGVFLVLLAGFATASSADADKEIEIILSHPGDPPVGVVFETVEGDEDFLEWAIPQINKYVKKLRAKFPDINIAVVSHGKEEFALLKVNEKEYESIHKEVKKLVADDIPVHVCGTHASWYGHEDEDFPKYVDVAPVGPAQINDYENMGYTLVVIEKP